MTNTHRRATDGGYDDSPVIRSDNGGPTSDHEIIGYTFGGGHGNPRVLEPDTNTVYGAELNEEEGHVRIDENDAYELGEDETLGDYITSVGDDLGWTWLSSFARDTLETTGHDAHMDVIDTAFDRRIVSDSADYAAGFSGSFTYRDRDGHVHTLERQFDVYTDERHRTESGQPVALVKESYLTSEQTETDGRAGATKKEGQNRREIPIKIESDTGGELAAIHEFCREWHETRPTPSDV